MCLIYKTLLAFALSMSSLTFAITSGWNCNPLVKAYFHNSEMQRQWAWEILGKLKWQGDENVLDFGCGDGKISAELSRLIPRGRITGYDISGDMLAFANVKFPNSLYPNLEFKKSHSFTFDDCCGDHSYDVVCAFCVFHQVKHPIEVLNNLKTYLKPKGKLLLVIPQAADPTFMKAGSDVFAKYQLEAPWKTQTPPSLTMRSIEGCYYFLKESGYQILELEMIDTITPYFDKQELVEWMIGTVAANWNVPLSISPQFFSDVVDRMCELEPEIIDQEGHIEFKSPRVYAVAIPK